MLNLETKTKIAFYYPFFSELPCDGYKMNLKLIYKPRAPITVDFFRLFIRNSYDLFVVNTSQWLSDCYSFHVNCIHELCKRKVYKNQLSLVCSLTIFSSPMCALVSQSQQISFTNRFNLAEYSVSVFSSHTLIKLSHFFGFCCLCVRVFGM